MLKNAKKIYVFLFFSLIGMATGGTTATMVLQQEEPLQFEVSSIESCYSPEGAKDKDKKDIEALIIEQIRQAQKSIYIAMYSFTLKKVMDELIKAQARNVHVNLIVDQSQADRVKSLVPHIDAVYKAGAFKQKMHHKFAVIDENRVLTGSANWTNNGVRKNRDHCRLIKNKGIAQEFKKEWDRCQKAPHTVRYGQL